MMTVNIFVVLFLIFTLLLNFTSGVTVSLLSFSNGSSIGMFNLWYLSNTSCGVSTDNFFRSDLIDIIDPAASCPEFYYIKFTRADGTFPIAFKFSSSYPSIEDVFLSDSVYETPVPGTPQPHQSQINTNDGYQYRQTDATGRYMYAGIRYGPNATNVQFIFDVTGHDLEGDLPASSDVVKIELLGVYQSACTDTTTESPPDIPYCDTLPSVAVESAVYNVIYGDSVTLRCTINSQLSVYNVTWVTVLEGNINMNITSLPEDMIYSIDTVTFNHGGFYKCVAYNQLRVKNFGVMLLNVSGGIPTVTTITPSSINKNTTDSVIFDCSVTSTPSVTNVYWKKSVSGVDTTVNTADARFSIGSLPKSSLTLTNLQESDAGQYFCVATNILGEGSSPGITLTVTDINNNNDMCPCSCEYKAKVDYWAAHNVSNMTHDEIVIWLQPKIIQLEKVLTLDKTNISAIINKRISATDSRPSARNLGVIGVVVMVTVMTLIILVDISSCTKHAATIKMLCGTSTTEQASGQ